MIVLACGEALGPTPAGPALRVAGIARALARRGFAVTVAAPPGSIAPDGCELAPLDDLVRQARESRATVISGFLLERYPDVAEAPALCVDLAGPFLIENLWVHQALPEARRRAMFAADAAVLRRLLAAADLVLSATRSQRDLLTGALLGAGLLQPRLLDSDSDLESYLAVVPFGSPDGDPPARAADDHGPLRVVWPGGLWQWLDPLTLIDAVAIARRGGADVVLELWGARSPDPSVPAMPIAGAAEQRAREQGLGSACAQVAWVPYAERARRLAQAHLAATLDCGTLEARFAFRTRLLDALWAGLPTLATRGEHVADAAAAAHAGWTIEPGDAGAAASLLASFAADRGPLAAAGARGAALAAEYRYDATVEPLARWCAAPARRRASRPEGTPTRLRRRLRRG